MEGFLPTYGPPLRQPVPRVRRTFLVGDGKNVYPPRLAFPIYEAGSLLPKRLILLFDSLDSEVPDQITHGVFGPYLRIFFSGITQRPVLQEEKGPPGVLKPNRSKVSLSEVDRTTQ